MLSRTRGASWLNFWAIGCWSQRSSVSGVAGREPFLDHVLALRLSRFIDFQGLVFASQDPICGLVSSRF